MTQEPRYLVCLALSSIQFAPLAKAQKGGCNPGGLSWGSSAPGQNKHNLIWRELFNSKHNRQMYSVEYSNQLFSYYIFTVYCLIFPIVGHIMVYKCLTK